MITTSIIESSKLDDQLVFRCYLHALWGVKKIKVDWLYKSIIFLAQLASWVVKFGKIDNLRDLSKSVQLFYHVRPTNKFAERFVHVNSI